MLRLILVLFFLTKAYALAAGESIQATDKDNLALQLLLKYELMKACKKVDEFARRHNMPAFKQPEFLWCQYHNGMKDLLKQYLQDKEGISRQDFWMFYNECCSINETNFQSFTQKPVMRPSPRNLLIIPRCS